MVETGRPLIPRELLPAPVVAARERHRGGRRDAPADVDPGRQLSFFDAETVEPTPADLAGLLAGTGVLGRMGGTARVSVTVDAAWRVHVLIAELSARGLEATWTPLSYVRPEPAELVAVPDPADDHPPDPADDHPPDPADDQPADPADGHPAGAGPPAPVPGGDGAAESDEEHAETTDTPDGGAVADGVPEKEWFEVRTAYSRRLNALARAWPQAAAHLFLSGHRLRLWAAAAGGPVRGGFALGLDPAKDLAAIDAALVRAGLAGRVTQDGRRYVISGRRRLARLAELVGERPPAAPEAMWPGGAGA